MLNQFRHPELFGIGELNVLRRLMIQSIKIAFQNVFGAHQQVLLDPLYVVLFFLWHSEPELLILMQLPSNVVQYG